MSCPPSLLVAAAACGAALAWALTGAALIALALIVMRAWSRLLTGKGTTRMFGLNPLLSIGLRVALAGLLALSIYAAGRHDGAHAEHRRSDPKVEAICGAAAASWAESGKGGKPLARGKWGRQCLAAVQGLAKFKGDALAARQVVLEQHQANEAAKTTADADRATRDAMAMADAQEGMQREDAKVQNDRLGADWFAQLNRVGGLRQPGQAAAAHRALPDAGDAPPY